MSSLMSMPVLVVNLGGEMMYVLRQRLGAQQIDPAKAQQVLDDVVGAMFHEDFMAALFQSLNMYSQKALLEVFQRLAHCSIMKLNHASMAKLYDLMTMVFKYQLVNCRSPREVVGLTLRHLDEMQSFVSAPVAAQVAACRERFQGVYLGFSIGQFWSLKQTLLDFVQGRHTKVSLLLQEKLQASDGRMFLSLDGPCPPETPVPGRVRHFDAEASISCEYAVSVGVLEEAEPQEFTPAAYEQAHATLGANLYALFRGDAPGDQSATTTAAADSEGKHADTGDDNDGGGGGGGGGEEKRLDAADELNLLANLVGPPVASELRFDIFASANDILSFGDDAGADVGASAGHACGAAKDHRCETVSVDAKASHKSMNQRMHELNFDVETGASKEADDDDDDDLLDLLDQAAEGDNDYRAHK